MNAPKFAREERRRNARPLLRYVDRRSDGFAYLARRLGVSLDRAVALTRGALPNATEARRIAKLVAKVLR